MKSIPRGALCILGLFSFATFLLLTVTNDREMVVDGWDFNTTRNTSQYVVRNVQTASLMPQHFCDQQSLLVMMVCSAPKNFEARNAVRETWGQMRNVLGNNVSLYFLLGETLDESMQLKIQKESDDFGDIIQENFVDSYNNLTLKSVVMLKLVSKKCSDTGKFILKIDDDMYVNVKLLVEQLLERNSTKNVLMGSLICGAKPIKDKNSKWYAPSYLYKGNTYPNYLSGTGYLMSIDVAEKLLETSFTTPIFYLEDIYLTGICASKAKIKPKHNPRFTFQVMRHDACIIRNLITVHHLSPKQIRTFYKTLSSPQTEQRCNQLKPAFATYSWIYNNILTMNKTYRRDKCD